MGSFEWMEVEALSGEIAALDARLAQARARHNHGLVKVLRDEIASAQQRRTKYLANISTSLANSLDPVPPAKAGAADKPAPKDDAKLAEPELAEPADAVAAEAKEEAVVAEEPEIEPEEAEQPDEIAAEADEEPAVAEEPEAEPAEEIAAEAEEEPAVAEELEPEPAEEMVAEAEEEPVAAESSADAVEPRVEAEPAAPVPQRAEAAEPVAKSSIASPGADATMGVSAVWNQLSATDIEQAKRQLDIRRSEMLARHAEELKTLEADQVQIDALAQAIDAFVRKFNTPADDGSVVRLDEKRQQA